MGIFDLLFGKISFGRTTVSREAEQRIKGDWQKVEQLLKLGGPSNLRQALVVADRALDTALKELYSGESMGARLKEASTKFERTLYNNIWEAHKMRNSMVHEAGFEPPYYAIQKGVNDLKSALFYLGVNV